VHRMMADQQDAAAAAGADTAAAQAAASAAQAVAAAARDETAAAKAEAVQLMQDKDAVQANFVSPSLHTIAILSCSVTSSSISQAALQTVL
jgi:hypothetical protein